MRGFIGLTRRNLLLYFKDKQSVFFSLLTSIIVFVLYLLFLKGTFVSSLEEAMTGLENIISSSDVEMFVNGLLLTGIMGSAMITVSYNCLSNVVKDKENRIDYDILATPMKRWAIIFSYFLSSVIAAFIMTALILTIGLIVLSVMGNTYLTIRSIALLYGIILLGAISATAFFMVLVIFFKSTAASSAFFGMLSAAAGFVIGAFIPLSQFSNGMQTACNIFPGSHITVLFRKMLLSDVVAKMDKDINGLDMGEFAKRIKDIFTFNPNMFGKSVETRMSLVYVCIFAIISLAAMVVLYGKNYKRK